MDTIVNVVGDLVKLGGGLWLISWLKDIIRETFKKIDDLEKKVTKMEHEQEFKAKYNIKDGQDF